MAPSLEMGTKTVHMMKPVGEGQRMLIIGDRMTGKTTVGVDAIINRCGPNADVLVFFDDFTKHTWIYPR